APVVEQRGSALRAGMELVSLDHDAQPLAIVAQHVAHAEVVGVLRTLLRPAGALFLARARIDFDEVDLSRVAAVAERAVLVVDVGDAARDAGREVAPG